MSGLLALVMCVASSATFTPVRAQPRDEWQRGVALGLFASREDWDYAPLLDEVVAHGATDVELVVAWYQQDIRSTVIEPRAGYSPSDATVRRTLRQARERGLRVLLLPIIRIHERAPGEWRGKVEFSRDDDANAWWESYRAFVLAMAQAAHDEGAQRFSVGSELLKLEKERARWASLIRDVRAVYVGRVMYSANWDHFEGVTFWDLLDEAGMTAYFELTQKDAPTAAELDAAWKRWTPQLKRFSSSLGRPIIFTEAGYPSLDGANRFPWDETRKAAVDVEEQRLCYRALLDSVGRAQFLGGIYFWNWFGYGGATDGDYTPRAKPAAREMREFFLRR